MIMGPIKIALVDDHPFFRGGVRRALHKVKDVKLVAEGGTADDAGRIAVEHQPDVMLLDITMPGGGIAAAREIAKCSPRTRIVMLTGSDDDDKVAAALEAGAIGYVLKGADTAELLQAVRAVQSGQAFITPMLSSRLLLDSVRTRRAAEAEAAIAQGSLNNREREILDLVTQGKTNSEIADTLNLALPTVKNYISRIFEKLQVRNRAEAIAFNLRRK
ncbi:MAG: response regulator transcription factor [Hyphomicrobiaceae bacterium]|nr:response regulator transcription factor [Hyphomicrobiaceae bacterium]